VGFGAWAAAYFTRDFPEEKWIPKHLLASVCAKPPSKKAKPPPGGAAHHIPVQSDEHVQDFKVKWTRIKHRRCESKTRTQTHTPQTPARIGGVRTAQPGLAGCSQNPYPSTHTQTAHPSQDWRGTGRARTQTHTPQHPSQDWRGESKTHTQTHTPQTPARIGGVKPKPALEHTHRRPQPGLAGYRQGAHTPTPQPGLVG
jgi:hypothetical protein